MGTISGTVAKIYILNVNKNKCHFKIGFSILVNTFKILPNLAVTYSINTIDPIKVEYHANVKYENPYQNSEKYTWRWWELPL